MNSLLLLLITLVIFFFGYRYFARFLQQNAFRPAPTSPTQAATGQQSIAVRFRNASSLPHEILGTHFAAVATLSSITGGSIALYWGWVPAFLWLVVGTTVAAGSFALGSLWLRHRSLETGHDNATGSGFPALLLSGFPANATPALLMLIALILVGLALLLAYLTAVIVANFPSSSWPLLVLLAVAGLAGRVTGNQQPVLGQRLPTYLIGIIVILLSIWISQGSTLAFSGGLNFDLSGKSLVSVTGTTIWSVLLLLFAVFVQRQPFEAWQKSLGVISTGLTLLVLLLFFVGLAVSHPEMSAPAYNKEASPGILPWLFITLTSGAFAGFQFLIAYGQTAPKLPAETDSRYVGYGAALLEGLLVLMVILAFGATLGSKQAWIALYKTWQGVPDGITMIGHFVNGVINSTNSILLSDVYAEALVALMLAALSLSSLIAVVRLLRVLIQELSARYHVPRLASVKASSWFGYVLLLVLLLLLKPRSGAQALEQVLAPAYYLLASVATLLMARALVAQQRPPAIAWGLFGFSALIGIWSWGMLIGTWYGENRFLELALALTALAAYATLLVHTGRGLLRKPAATPPPEA